MQPNVHFVDEVEMRSVILPTAVLSGEADIAPVMPVGVLGCCALAETPIAWLDGHGILK